MPYANNQGIHIYYETEGEGPPFVLQHGLGGSVEGFKDAGWVDGLKDAHRLILIDARGHGASDKPHDPEAYRMALRVADVVAVLDELDIAKAHFCGYSMGGWIGWGIAKYAPQRFHSLILGGAGLREEASDEPSPFVELFQQEWEAVLTWMEQAFGQWWTPEVKAVNAANDQEALLASVSKRDEPPLLQDLLPSVTMPCLLFAGECAEEYQRVKECAERLSNATFVSLPGLDHIDGFFRSDLVLPHIVAFLESVKAGIAEAGDS